MTTVLLLEDETMIQMLIEDIISDFGYKVLPTSNIEEALEVIDTDTFDFALLDINLGDGSNSFPIAKILTERGISFAFMTGYHTQSIDGFEEVPKLSKPINFPLLEKTLKEFAKGDVAPQPE